MIGDGELKNECMNKIYEYGLINNIKMLGFTENPYINLKRVIHIPNKIHNFSLFTILQKERKRKKGNFYFFDFRIMFIKSVL